MRKAAQTYIIKRLLYSEYIQSWTHCNGFSKYSECSHRECGLSAVLEPMGVQARMYRYTDCSRFFVEC
jgi:hypothetical protein